MDEDVGVTWCECQCLGIGRFISNLSRGDQFPRCNISFDLDSKMCNSKSGEIASISNHLHVFLDVGRTIYRKCGVASVGCRGPQLPRNLDASSVHSKTSQSRALNYAAAR